MNILERYIASTCAALIALALLLVLGVDFLFAYVHELGGIGRGDYNAGAAFLYTALTLPSRLYQLFPMASLIGVLLALGLLSSRSELIVMRASGFSVFQIARAVMKVGLVLAVLVTLLGEFAVPKAEYTAETLKVRAKSGGQAVLTARGTWVREGDNFIHIRKLLPKGELQDVTYYEFNHAYQLQSAIFIETAQYEKDYWTLTNIQKSNISPERITTQTSATETWPSLVDPTLLDVLLSKPNDLSMFGLYKYIAYLKNNHQDASYYQLAFWKKIITPFSVMVMVFLGVPFVFGPLRSVSMGLRILAGIVVGFAFYLSNEIFGPLSLVYSFPPIIAAMIPPCLFFFLGYLMMRRVR
jgi:lipopolysaccharide export system permease protein